jgi:hypothetical protein
MNYDKARERYEQDPVFHAVVEQLKSIVIRLEMTPSEIREAATFACILIEERMVRRTPRYAVEETIGVHPVDDAWLKWP